MTTLLLPLLIAGLPIQDYRTLRYDGVIGQTSDFTCGPAALATLLTYYLGRPTTERAMTERTLAASRSRGLSVQDGLSMLALRDALASVRVPASGHRLTLDELRDFMTAQVPVIVHVTAPRGHFYLVLAVQDDVVLLADPSWGVRAQPTASFVRNWSGLVLVPRMTESEQARARTEVRRHLTRYSDRVRRLHDSR